MLDEGVEDRGQDAAGVVVGPHELLAAVEVCVEQRRELLELAFEVGGKLCDRGAGIARGVNEIGEDAGLDRVRGGAQVAAGGVRRAVFGAGVRRAPQGHVGEVRQVE